MDYSLPGSSVHGILQARIQEWIAMPASGGSFGSSDGTLVSYVSCVGSRSFITNVTSEAQRKIITFSEAQRKIIKFSVLGLTLEDHWKWVRFSKLTSYSFPHYSSFKSLSHLYHTLCMSLPCDIQSFVLQRLSSLIKLS